jgi:alpha-beta hydrolase superfamily lysophospholipase
MKCRFGPDGSAVAGGRAGPWDDLRLARLGELVDLLIRNCLARGHITSRIGDGWLRNPSPAGAATMNDQKQPSLNRALGIAALLVAGVAQLRAAEPQPPVKNLILPGESFLVQGRPAFIFWPPESQRQKPQPWIMYAPTLAAYPDNHEKWMHEQFLAAGVAVAGIDVGEAYGSPQGQQWMTALYAELTEKRGFAAKPCLLGRSRGGLWVSSWAIAHPDKVAGIAGIYPVFDLRSYPGISKAAPAYGMTVEELEAGLAQHNPIQRMGVLATAKLPVCIIHGDQDHVVPLAQNATVLLERYQQAGAADAVRLIIAEGQGHNYWEGFFRCQSLIDFAVQRAQAGVESETAAERPVAERR